MKTTMTQEGRLTDAFDKYCHKHNIPFCSGVNGPGIEGWSKKPDRVLGTENDDLLTKSIAIEIKPKKVDAFKDLAKEKYKTFKYLGAIYFKDNESYGCLCSWHDPNLPPGFQEIIEYPLEQFIKFLYEQVYKKAINSLKFQIISEAMCFVNTKRFTEEQVFNVMSGSFTNNSIQTPLDHSLGKFYKKCCKVMRSIDKIEIMHGVKFAKGTYDERYQLGQFITEWPYTLHIAEKVVELFDKNTIKTIYEPCIGTGAITKELLTLLNKKYGSRKAKKIMLTQMKFADIDPSMRAFAEVVLYVHTEELFGEGIYFNIESSNLKTDDFDLSNMIVYGNYPFNKGKDYNYLAKILRQQYNSGLVCGCFIINTLTIDPRKIQSKKILGDFLNHVKVLKKLKFDGVAVDISLIEYNENIKKEKENVVMLGNFVPLKSLVIIHNTAGFIGGTKFKDGSFIYRQKLDYGTPLIQQKDLWDSNPTESKIPLPNSPVDSEAQELYTRFIKEGKSFPKIPEAKDQLLVGRYTTTAKHVLLRYFKNFKAVDSGGTMRSLTGTSNVLGAVGLILQSLTFKTKLHKYLPKFMKTQKKLAGDFQILPIPKNIPQRLCDIGLEVIIKGNENKELRAEADKIIEELYKDLEI